MAKESREYAKKFAKIVFGLLLVLLGIWLYIPTGWYHNLLYMVYGAVGLVVVLIGLVLLLIGWSD